ncbi:MAG TPA: ArsI/CadI family heavy metal resistance metalloenzyme [Kofleriaceae bacterium]|nr:ArsI/CadI family heavy metal resistance metalloenzyme [Kofleriaceae bacterium]
MNILKPHVSLNVSDIDRSVEFYQKAFGVAASKRRPGYAKFDLEAPLLNLTMVQAPRTGINASHFGVQVASTADVDEARRRFEAAGLLTASEENTACCYALQDKVWVEDPDGNSWEVFVVKADAPVMKATASTCCAPVDVAHDSAPAARTTSCCAPGAAADGT